MKKALVFGLILLLLAVGCIKKQAEAPATPAEMAAPTAEAPDEPRNYAFTFTAKTLDGNTVTESVFGRYDLTMVNVWASWCGPCCAELGDLGKLYGNLPENVGFLSVTVDEPGDLQEAADLLKKNGCTFPCLNGQASAGLMTGFLKDVMAIPTTLFFDRDGNQVGQRILGVPQGSGSVVDTYLAEIRARLSLLAGK